MFATTNVLYKSRAASNFVQHSEPLPHVDSRTMTFPPDAWEFQSTRPYRKRCDIEPVIVLSAPHVVGLAGSLLSSRPLAGRGDDMSSKKGLKDTHAVRGMRGSAVELRGSETRTDFLGTWKVSWF